jgi:ribonucleoside-diphosphate reductase alpha chain
MSGASGKKLDDTYKLAWLRGLKTTYYLRTISATHAEKSTVTNNQMNAVSSGSSAGSSAGRATASSAAVASQFSAMPATDVKFTAIDDEGCEACQ